MPVRAQGAVQDHLLPELQRHPQAELQKCEELCEGSPAEVRYQVQEGVREGAAAAVQGHPTEELQED